jgi:SNF2 family DNA or RNA helicase
MLVLHAAFATRRLLVWMEPEPDQVGLVEAVARAGAKVARNQLVDAVVWMPFREDKPTPSVALVGDMPLPDEECYLAPAVVNVAPLEAGPACDLLAACADKRVLAPGLIVGEDLAFWAHAMRFASGLVARAKHLPTLRREESGYFARWLPVVSGQDASRFAALARAMPPVARAATFDDSDDPPATPAETALAEFVEAVVDALVRESAGGRQAHHGATHDRWLDALAAPDAKFKGTDAEAATLAQQAADWQRSVQVSALAPFRLCFRLAEPADKDAAWRVEYVMQGTRDPSLFVPAAEVWSPTKVAKKVVADSAALRELLLASLGQAAGISDAVNRSLNEKSPDGYGTDSIGARDFLRLTAPLLEQGGFGVILPSWWTRHGAALRLKARARVKSPPGHSDGALSMGAILEFDWKLALGDHEISAKELRALAQQKSTLVKVRGQWVEVDAGDIKDALDFLAKGPRKASLGEIVRMAIGATGSAGKLEIDGIDAEGWVGDMLAQLKGERPFRELAPPEQLRAQLRPYQVRGYSWLDFLKTVGLGACLADDMGLGKTIQTLALVRRDRALGETRPVLLVCPTSVAGNWQREAERFTPDLPVLVHHGVGRRKGDAFREQAERHALVVSTYSLLGRDLAILRTVPWAGVILDEAQNIKNPETAQAKAARGFDGGYRIALTGTPVENSVGDLWSIMEFLNPGFLGSRGAFQTRFFRPIQVYRDPEAADRLRRITGPFILRRLKTDKSIIADLPDKIEAKVYCNLTREQATLYEAVVRDGREAVEKAEGIGRKGLVLALLMKLKQVCNHPAQFLKDRSSIPGRSGKLARLVEMLEEALAADDRSLVFTQFAEMGEILHAYLQESFGTEVLFLHGGSGMAQRNRMVERFAAPDGPRVFLLSLKAGGTGLNLTRASHVFHFDRWWNPAVENQATDRAFRIGQAKNVQVHKFVCVGTLEEKIDEMIERKKDVAGRVVGTGEAWLGNLSNSELRELLALGRDAVGE